MNQENLFIKREGMSILVEKNERTVDFLAAFSQFGLAEFLTVRSDLCGINLPCTFSENETHYIFTISLRVGQTTDDVDLETIFDDLIEDLTILLTISKKNNIVFFLVGLSKLGEGEPEGACRIIAIESSKINADEAATEAWGKVSQKLSETGLDRYANDVGILLIRAPEPIRRLMIDQMTSMGTTQN